MTQLYLRKFSLVLAADNGKGLDLADLHCQFLIRQNETSTPTQCDIRIYNPSPETIHRAGKEFSQVQIQAGYDGLFGTIFSGTIVQRRNGRTTPVDTYLDITAYDGDLGHNFAVVNTTLAAGATQADVAKAVCTAMNPHGITQGYTDGLASNALPRGRVLYGMARDHLQDVADATGTTYSIDKGKVVFVPRTSYLPGEAVVLTAATGMIGMPQQTMDGIMVRCLINPLLRVYGRLKIDNASIQDSRLPLNNAGVNQLAAEQIPKRDADGLYRILSIDYCGDTRGNDWYCDIACMSLTTDAHNVPPGQIARGRAGTVTPVVPAPTSPTPLPTSLPPPGHA